MSNRLSYPILVLSAALRLSAQAFPEASDPAALVGANVNYESQAAMWVWADKNVYEVGQPLTARLTLKPNDDPYPYTVFAYRQNNQTGVKTYLPRGTSEATDIFGNTATQGFRAVRLAALSKQVVVGQGGAIVNQTIAIPEEFGMHTLVVELRDYQAGRVIKASYFKFGVVRGFEDLPNNITADRYLTNDRAYRIRGIVQVRNGASLTIEPGTFVIGMPGSQPPSVLLVSNTGKLFADGTRARPIIMTSSQPIGSRQRGDWGGLVMLGKAIVNDPGGSLSIEGLPDSPETTYGGTDDNHSCGVLRYVRVEFAGALLRPNEETNSFTWGGCGKLTKGEYLQAHYGLDDSFEWFGGSNDNKYLLGTYGADDYVDFQIGYRGRIQHVVAVANADLSNRGIEGDNYERDFAAKPFSKPLMYNLTFIGNNAQGFDETDASAVHLRRGAAGSFNNILTFNWSTGALSFGNAATITDNIRSKEASFDGILAWDNGRHANKTNALDSQFPNDLRQFIGNAATEVKSVVVVDPKLRRPLEYSDPDLRPAPGSPVFGARWIQPPDDGFFDQWAQWIGGVGTVNWMEEWTTFIQEEDMK